jgi:hypothetical protein
MAPLRIINPKTKEMFTAEQLAGKADLPLHMGPYEPLKAEAYSKAKYDHACRTGDFSCYAS